MLPGGADWQVVRPDGTIEIDTRYSARTADGALLHLRTHGIRAGSADVLAALVAGEEVPATDVRVPPARDGRDIRAGATPHLERSLIVAAAARGEGSSCTTRTG